MATDETLARIIRTVRYARVSWMTSTRSQGRGRGSRALRSHRLTSPKKPQQVKKIIRAKSSTQHSKERAARLSFAFTFGRKGKFATPRQGSGQGNARQSEARRGATTTINVLIDKSHPRTPTLSTSLVTITFNPREWGERAQRPGLRLDMPPQAEANSPPPPSTGNPDLFSRPRPRPPRSPSQAAKIRVQNRRRQYLENNPNYLSSADNQLAGKPQVIPAPWSPPVLRIPFLFW